MGKIKFGRRQLDNPTPRNLANRIDIYCVVAGAVLTWMGTTAAAFIPSYVSTGLQSILGLTITIGLALKPFFGVKTTARKVDIDKVGSMDSQPYSAPKDGELKNK